MKIVSFFLFIFLSFSSYSTLNSNDPDFQAKLQQANDPNSNNQGTFSEQDEQEDQLSKLVETMPQLKNQYKSCQDLRSKVGVQNFPMGECIWEGYSDKKHGSVEKLDDTIKEQVTAKLEAEQDQNGRSVASESSPSKTSTGATESLDITNFNRNKDKVMRKLEDHLKERFKKMLFDDDPKKIKAVNDHQLFHNLYSTQLGRNVINVISNFCMQTEIRKPRIKEEDCRLADDQLLVIPEDKEARAAIKKANIKKMSTDINATDKHFKLCLTSVSQICGGEGNYHRSKKLSNYVFASSKSECKEKDVFSEDPYSIQGKKKGGEFKETRIQACQVVKYIKASKQALLQVKEINEGWEKIAEKNSNDGSIQLANRGERADFEKDELINIGSGDLVSKDSGIEEAAKEEKEMLEKCQEEYQPESGGPCDKYLISEEENLKIKDEFELRKFAMSDKVNQVQKDDDKLKAYLEEEGVSADKIEEILNDENKVIDIRRKITQRYKNERDAIIAKFAEKLNSRTVFEEDKKNPDIIKQKFEAISKEAEKKPEEYAQIAHYSNVVSSLLSLKQGDKEIGSNVRALNAELKSSYFNPSGGRELASARETQDATEHFKGLQEVAKEKSSKKQADLGKYETGGLSVDQINQTILQYFDK